MHASLPNHLLCDVVLLGHSEIAIVFGEHNKECLPVILKEHPLRSLQKLRKFFPSSVAEEGIESVEIERVSGDVFGDVQEMLYRKTAARDPGQHV